MNKAKARALTVDYTGKLNIHFQILENGKKYNYILTVPTDIVDLEADPDFYKRVEGNIIRSYVTANSSGKYLTQDYSLSYETNVKYWNLIKKEMEKFEQIEVIEIPFLVGINIYYLKIADDGNIYGYSRARFLDNNISIEENLIKLASGTASVMKIFVQKNKPKDWINRRLGFKGDNPIYRQYLIAKVLYTKQQGNIEKYKELADELLYYVANTESVFVYKKIDEFFNYINKKD